MTSKTPLNHAVAASFDAMVANWERCGEPLTIQFACEALARSGCVKPGDGIIDVGAENPRM